MLNVDFDAAIFDMDGTLLNSMRYWRYTTLEYLLKYDMPVRDKDLVRMLDTSSRKLVMEIAGREGIDVGSDRDVIVELEGFMNEHYKAHIQLKDAFVPGFLRKLKDGGVKMCVATAAPREFARNGLYRNGILDFFEFVTDTYEFSMSKSNPEYFRTVAERLGTVPERCMVFEDALYAMKSAKEAGCRVVAIEDLTARKQKEEIQSLADIYIRNYSEIL